MSKAIIWQCMSSRFSYPEFQHFWIICPCPSKFWLPGEREKVKIPNFLPRSFQPVGLNTNTRQWDIYELVITFPTININLTSTVDNLLLSNQKINAWQKSKIARLKKNTVYFLLSINTSHIFYKALSPAILRIWRFPVTNTANRKKRQVCKCVHTWAGPQREKKHF